MTDTKLRTPERKIPAEVPKKPQDEISSLEISDNDPNHLPLIIGGITVGVGIVTVALVATLAGDGDKAPATTTIPEGTTTSLGGTSSTLDTIVTNPNMPVYDEFGFLVNPVLATIENTDGGDPTKVVELLGDNLQFAFLYNDLKLIDELFAGAGGDSVQVLSDLSEAIEAVRIGARWNNPLDRVEIPYIIGIELLSITDENEDGSFTATFNYRPQADYGELRYEHGTEQLIKVDIVVANGFYVFENWQTLETN